MTDAEAGARKAASLAGPLSSTPGIVVLCAPPGFGKSEVLTRAQGLIQNTPSASIRRFDRAQHRLAPDAAAEAILQAGADQLIIVDGLQGADRGAISEALSVRFPSQDAPRLWLSIHHLKDLALARLVAGGAATIIDWRSLKLSDGDLRLRLARVPPRFKRVVGDLGRAWPAACSLLSRWAQQAPPDEADWEVPAILAASGLDGYIEQEIDPVLSSEELEALIHASITETIEVDADRRGVTRSHEQQAIMRASSKIAGLIERQGSKLIVQPALRHWLTTRFEELPSHRQVESLAHAAREFEGRGDLVVAARLFRSAGREAEIERLIADRGSLLIWMTHGFPAIRELVDQAGDILVSRSPILQLMRCIVLMKTGRISEAQELFATIDADACAQTPSLERDHEVVRIALLTYGCALQRDTDLDRFHAIVARSVDEPDWKSLLSTLACILHTQRARFDSALANLIDARVHARSAASRYNLLFLSLHEANIHLAQGDLKKARAALNDARRRWRQEFPEDRGAETVMSALAASLEYELGQLSSARASVRKSAYRMPDSEAWFDVYAAAYEPMARLIAVDHGLGPAIEALADQRRRLIAQGLPRVAALLQNLAIILAGEAWLRTGTAPSDPIWDLAPLDVSPSWQEEEAHHLARAWLRLRQGDAVAAVRGLREISESSESRRLARSTLRYQLALAAFLAHENNPDADAELRRAIVLAADLGARQAVQHVMSREVARAVARLGETAPARSDLKRFISTLQSSSRAAEGSKHPLLSAREIDVLKALSEGGSDKVIGRMLDMSEHGVRFHLKSIYRKLNVHDRLAAVHRAKELSAI